MHLLNGVPVIVGLGLIHITLLNLIAIVIEYAFINSRVPRNRNLLRSIIANLLSVLIGFFVIITVPDFLGSENLGHAEPELSRYDYFTLVIALIGCFLVNVLVEYPVYIFRSKVNKRRMFFAVLIANFISNIPVFVLYMMI